MQVQLEQRIMTSFLLKVDNALQQASGFTNQTINFYPAYSDYANRYVYTANTRPLCNDTSVSGATIISGLMLNQSPVLVGESGLLAINHYKGAVYFSSALPKGITISGSGARKEVNVKLTDQTDWHLMYESQYHPQPINSPTGLPLDLETTPIVFLRFRGMENKPLCFAKLDNQSMMIRGIIVANNEFQKISITSILKNLNYTTIPLVTSTPFDAVGNMTGLNYNYNQLTLDTSYTPMILSVRIIDQPSTGPYASVARNMAIADFEISTFAKS